VKEEKKNIIFCKQGVLENYCFTGCYLMYRAIEKMDGI